eukprot:gene12504-6252_t
MNKNSTIILLILTTLFASYLASVISCSTQTAQILDFETEDVSEFLEEASLEESVDCRDRNVCVVKCPNGEDRFFDLAPLLKYETTKQNSNQKNKKWFEEYQAYREVCIKRSGTKDLNEETKEIFKIFNQKLSKFLDKPQKQIDENIFKGVVSTWSFNYEKYIKGLKGLTKEKKTAAIAFSKFLWVMRSLKRLCTNKKHSVSEVVGKFKLFDVDYRDRMFRARGADYSQDPGKKTKIKKETLSGLYAYLNEHQFKSNMDMAKAKGDTKEYQSKKQELDYYEELKNSVVKPVVKLYMKETYHDYCQCSGFKTWYENTMKSSEQYLWDHMRMVKANLSVFPKYFETMDSACNNTITNAPASKSKSKSKRRKKFYRKNFRKQFQALSQENETFSEDTNDYY